MIKPCITFKKNSEEAVKLYTSVFPNSKIISTTRAEKDNGPVQKGQVLGIEFILDGREFLAFDGGDSFSFSEGISLMVDCKTQEEVDRYWTKLTANGGEEGPCGWLKDPYGLSWQIVPERLTEMLSDPKSGNSDAAMSAMLKMKKLDIATLEKAYRGSPVG
jgi:predicted 3-demethylubiquinone-9 3-methyltransferase (glyoxalase superfamily)